MRFTAASPSILGPSEKVNVNEAWTVLGVAALRCGSRNSLIGWASALNELGSASLIVLREAAATSGLAPA